MNSIFIKVTTGFESFRNYLTFIKMNTYFYAVCSKNKLLLSIFFLYFTAVRVIHT